MPIIAESAPVLVREQHSDCKIKIEWPVVPSDQVSKVEDAALQENRRIFKNSIVVLGFGSIGSGLLPLIYDMFQDPVVTVITADERNMNVAKAYPVTFKLEVINKNNYAAVLQQNLTKGDFLVNLTVDISTVDLVAWCQIHEVLYLDTVIEPWEGYYTDPSKPAHQRTNHFLRQELLRYKASSPYPTTAVIAHGANPGLVNHLVKKALMLLAARDGASRPAPRTQEDWARLAHELGVSAIHIAERDTQRRVAPRVRGEFVNTWSVDGFVAEASQPSELGWGTHERAIPADAGFHPPSPDGSPAAGCPSMFLLRPGAATRVRSWTPEEGPIQAFLITHNESLSIADFLSTVIDGRPYRPTVLYAYLPCDAAICSLHELAGNGLRPPQRAAVLGPDDVEDGTDELGVLLMGSRHGSLWYGSRLSIAQARAAAPHNTATSLQVTAAVAAGMRWAVDNPRAGVLEADDLPYVRILDLCQPYLGDVLAGWTDWTPLQGRSDLFPEAADPSDPWQFVNFRIA